MALEKSQNNQTSLTKNQKYKTMEEHFPEDSHAPKLQTSNHQLQTSIMEVHKHPHHVMHRKKWSEYLLEFLMLFLAVFLGFVAENFREHQVEKERGRQYIESFYEDLKTDTGRVSYNFKFDDSKLVVLEKLGDCYDTLLKNNTATSCLLDVIKISAINRPFKWTERTLNQLANAGGFRLLRPEDADSIIAYQKAFNNFQDFQLTVFQDAQNNVRNTFNLLINFTANDQMFQIKKSGLISTFDNKDVTATLLFSNDKGLLNKYFNDLKLYYRVTYNHKRMLLDLKENQIRLINYFKNKYHLE